MARWGVAIGAKGNADIGIDESEGELQSTLGGAAQQRRTSSGFVVVVLCDAGTVVVTRIGSGRSKLRAFEAVAAAAAAEQAEDCACRAVTVSGVKNATEDKGPDPSRLEELLVKIGEETARETWLR